MSMIGKYEKMMETKEVFDFVPTQIDKEEMCFAAYVSNDEGDTVKLVLPLADFFIGAERATKKLESNQVNGSLGRSIRVLVKEVNAFRDVVTCSWSEARAAERAGVISEIDACLDAGQYRDVNAKVKIISGEGNQSYAILETRDHIRLLLLVKQWSWNYINDLSDAVKVGDVIKVRIYKRNDSKHRVDYIVSKKMLLPNPWTRIGEKIHEGDTVVANVIESWKGGYSSRIDGLYGIVAYVERRDVKIPIVPGEKYACKVMTVNEETKNIRLHPVKHILDRSKMIQ